MIAPFSMAGLMAHRQTNAIDPKANQRLCVDVATWISRWARTVRARRDVRSTDVKNAGTRSRNQ
jgi:hypothetical protein